MSKKSKCRNRAKSLFPSDPELERSAKKACNGSENPELLKTRADFYRAMGLNDVWFIQNRGYDPNPDNGVNMEDVLKEQLAAAESKKNTALKLLKGLTIVLVSVAIIILIVKYVLK